MPYRRYLELEGTYIISIQKPSEFQNWTTHKLVEGEEAEKDDDARGLHRMRGKSVDDSAPTYRLLEHVTSDR
jgi:hypothetical protein